MTANDNPLRGAPPSEVPLTDPPLVRVVAQVRFPTIASVERREFIALFQEAIRSDYPVLRPEQSRGLVFGPEGAMDTRSTTGWRFHDASKTWQVALMPDSLALETLAYSSRDDFLRRFGQILEAASEHLDPRVIDRIGLRYIDRITGNNLCDLPSLVRPEVAGVLATTLAEFARHSVSESLFELPDRAHLLARWGLVPAGGTVDPAAVDVLDEPSWLLDLDAFLTDTRDFEVNEILARSRGFAERIYSFFRWAVTDEFLRRYGGRP